MARSIDVEAIVKAFNKKFGTFFRYGSESVSGAVKALSNKYTTEEILSYIEQLDAPQGADMYVYLNPVFVDMYFKAQNNAPVVYPEVVESAPVEPEPISPINSTPQYETSLDGLFGGLGNAIANALINQVAPELSKEIKVDVDKYIKAEYGTLRRTEVIDWQVPSRNGMLQNETTHEKFEEVLQFVMADEPVLLVGEAGTGKNVICKQVAKAMNLEFYFSNAVTQEYKLTGFIDANGTYQETQFYKAFKNGGLFMLDEIDASIPEVLIILNAAIANRYFDFPNGKIEAHPDFRIVAAGNTFGNGASYAYIGRNQLDASSLDRFAVIEVGYSPKIEESLTDDNGLIEFVRAFREACNQSGINHITSYRAITRMNKMKSAMPIEECLKCCLIKNMEKDDLNMIVNVINSSLGKNEWKARLQKCIRG